MKAWAAAWLDIKQRTLSPRGYNAAASPVRSWIMATIGRRRNVTATQLNEAGVEPVLIQSMLGHATAAQSGEYRRIHRAPKLEAVEKATAVLPFDAVASRPGTSRTLTSPMQAAPSWEWCRCSSQLLASLVDRELLVLGGCPETTTRNASDPRIPASRVSSGPWKMT
ncbi:hypothetical protein [Nocardioides sp. 1609]|uniref:hypothetical protein n=1 Tax=Nocardioides sp. 1609 TaxID=2508327 RepID=UPI00107025D8|nr:hypothetical protein [Nocardioides sp. 1609]